MQRFGPEQNGKSFNMNTQLQLVNKFGNPMIDSERVAFEKNHMITIDLMAYDRTIFPLPSKLYINKLMREPLIRVFNTLVSTKLYTEIKTFDGCFNVRYQRGSKTRISRHSWGLALDFNAAWNPLVKVTNPPGRSVLYAKHVTWSSQFLQVWRNEGFVCGADWKSSIDGMHFEYFVMV
jgi:hypothetical protein